MKYISLRNKRSLAEFCYSCGTFENYQEEAYQYTKLHAIDDILKSGCLIATDVYFLNDNEEYKFAFKDLKKFYPEIEEDYRFFSVSFTKKKDDVPQYMIYAGEIGVSIAYDFSFEAWGKWMDPDKMDQSDSNIPIFKPSLSCYTTGGKIFSFIVQYPKKITYLAEESREKIVGEMVKKLQEGAARGDIAAQAQYYLPCFIKNKAFESEKEVRFAVEASETSKEKIKIDHTKTEYYKANNNILRPYVSLFYSDSRQNIGMPIKAIWVGPGRNQDRAFESVIMRIEADDIKVFPLPLTEYIVRLMEYYEEMTNYINQKFPEAIISFLDFKKSIFGEEKGKDRIRDMTEYVLHKVRKEQEKTIMLSNKHGKKYCLWNEKQDVKDENSEWDFQPDFINVDNSDSEWKAKQIFLDIENAFKESLAEGIEKGLIQKIKEDILDDVENEIKIKKDYIISQIEDIIKEYRNIHYFSSKGISVYKSRKGLAH